MEEASGAQYALQVALQTLKDRCQQFQQRISDLEDENINLRATCRDSTHPVSSLPEIDALHLQVSQLTEQKLQLCKKVEMVTAENNNLWTRLSKLTEAKEHLDSKLIKINDTISSRNLVRSKTFTQNEPHIVFNQGHIQGENERLSLELEDISLKLLNSFVKEKHELETQCSQMAEMQVDTLFGNSYAFGQIGEETTDCDQVEKQLTILKSLKFAVLKQKENLERVESIIGSKSDKTCTTCKIQKSTTSASVQTSNDRKTSVTDEESAQLQSLLNWGTPENSLYNEVHNTAPKQVLNNENIKICPICSKIFYSNIKFVEFQQHVEHHFIPESDGEYEIS